MCGRYARTRNLTWREIHAFSQPVNVLPADDPPEAYNVAPTQPGYVIRPVDDDAAELATMRWGLLPVWAKDDRLQYSTINARLETVATKPAFRAAWKARRCVVPISGYYEWPVIDEVKRPHYIHPADSQVLLLAGLWEPGRGEAPPTYTIITTEADDSIRAVHDRMPLMLESGVLDDWMRGTVDQAAEIALAAAPPRLAFHEVAPAVGNVRNQGPELIKPI